MWKKKVASQIEFRTFLLYYHIFGKMAGFDVAGVTKGLVV